MKTVTLKVQANAMTSHEITIPAHEAAIVKVLFKGQVSEIGTSEDKEPAPSANDEYARLSAKYDGITVERVYGLPESEGLSKALEAHKAKA
ncbi:hypothetical protein [Thiothrix sp.]|jgi:hypothetical protein|uniref:hypothetical protein n=1 Tax=Thiothrix sp. TaxID=1032 RepID=UPI002580F103|nr:hypothetical protein [Thiothrix sp.]